MLKTLTILFATLTLCLTSSAQSLVGLWEGILYNDSTGLNYVYDIAITENKGKLFGYSRTGFIKDEEQFFNIKEISIKMMNGKVVTRDEGTISQHFPIAPPKGIFQLNVLQYSIAGADTILAGEFSTNRTKKFTQVTGMVRLVKKQGTDKSSMLPHLQELGLAANLSFLPKNFVIKSDAENNKPIIKAPLSIKERMLVVQQNVNFLEDSLSITLYDNGQVDGDTVSIFMNGDLYLARQSLSTKPIKFSVNTKALGDTFTLSMLAETVGSIPPNTGLMIVYDGKKRTEIRFSGDFEQTAAVIFYRQKNN